MSQVFRYPPSPVSIAGSITVTQGTTPWIVSDPAAEASLASIDGKVSTAANQSTGNASLASIDSKLTNPLPVSGPLTDAQLRAVPVPVSGTVTATGPLTDAQLRATPVPVSGTVTATGPLTDTQLRATPVPVSISSGISNPLPVQDSAAEASLASIDSKLTNPLPVSGTVTANAGTNLNTSALSLEATQLAFSAKSAGALVPEAFDYVALTYTGANLTTAVYKTGGAGGSTVATLTLAYTGAQLDSVTKT